MTTRAVAAPPADAGRERFLAERREHWNRLADAHPRRWNLGGTYHARLIEIYRFLVPPNQRVLEVGCGEGALLAALEPSFGLGIDFAGKMVERARRRFPALTFLEADAHTFVWDGEPFDVIVLSDLVNDLWDVQEVLARLRPLLRPTGFLVANVVSRLWELLLTWARTIGLARPVLPQNWFAPGDLVNLLALSGFETLRHWEEILLPVPVPGLATLANRFLVKVTPFRYLALSHFFLAIPPLTDPQRHLGAAAARAGRPPAEAMATGPTTGDAASPPESGRSVGNASGNGEHPPMSHGATVEGPHQREPGRALLPSQGVSREADPATGLTVGPRPPGKDTPAHGAIPSVSVIVPARNEVGNIRPLFERLPRMGSRTELVLVEGGSTDGTPEEIERCRAAFPDLPCLHLKQTGQGKGDAIRLGFARATGDILIILDADLTVAPEDLPRFYEVLASGRGRFVNGVRLVYPMEGEAMRFLNFLANKFFSLAFSWLLSQPIKDTLCGTKALWQCDERAIAAGRAYFGDFDPFGDFDLLFGAAKRHLKIVEIPIRYRDRSYGTTKIDRWTHGWLLLQMVVFAASRLKFV